MWWISCTDRRWFHLLISNPMIYSALACNISSVQLNKLLQKRVSTFEVNKFIWKCFYIVVSGIFACRLEGVRKWEISCYCYGISILFVGFGCDPLSAALNSDTTFKRWCTSRWDNIPFKWQSWKHWKFNACVNGISQKSKHSNL